MDFIVAALEFNMINQLPLEKIKSIFKFVILHFGIYLMWISLHYFASHLYIHWCVPATIAGLIISPFLVPAPHCYGLRWLIYQGGNSIVVMWSFIGGWLLSYFIPISNNQ